MSILIPKLINSWHMLACSVPDIPGMIDIFVSHLHLHILKPQRDMLIIDFHSPLKDRPRSNILINASFPFGVLDPSAHMVSLHPKLLLKVTPHSILVVLELILVHHMDLRWRAVLIRLIGRDFPHKLLGGNLLGGCLIILYFWDTHD